MSILHEIIERNREALSERKKVLPSSLIDRQKEARRHGCDFATALAAPGPNIIAELKKASPSKGIIRQDFDFLEFALEYQRNGAAAISVLTEPYYFQGSPNYLSEVAAQVNIPLLRKDFIFDPYQITEAVYLGADAILLIVAALETDHYRELLAAAAENRLAVLSEVHTMEELATAVECDAQIIGINCRNLKTFSTDPELTARLLREIPDDRIRIAESGIRTREQMLRFAALGANGFLIGETLMRAASPGVKLRELLQDT